MNKRKNWKLVPVNGRTQKKIKPRTSGTNLSLFKRDIDELIDEFVEVPFIYLFVFQAFKLVVSLVLLAG